MWWKKLPGLLICSLENAAKSFLGNFPQFFAQSLKKTKECFFFTTLSTSICSSGLIEQNSGNLAGIFSQKSRFFCSISELFSKKKHCFVRKNFFFKNDPQSSKKAISINPSKKSQLIVIRSSTIEKCDEKKHIWTFNMQFRERRQILSATSRRLLLKIWKRRKNFYSEQTLFSSKRSFWIVNQKFGNSCWFC